MPCMPYPGADTHDTHEAQPKNWCFHAMSVPSAILGGILRPVPCGGASLSDLHSYDKLQSRIMLVL